jgi:aspartate aminotransferase/aminotransferase
MPKVSQCVSHAEEAMSVRYNNIVYDLKRQGHEVIVLSLGEAFFDLPLKSMDDLPYPAGFHYSHSRGVPELRERVARYYGERYGVQVNPETEVLLTAGSKAAIYFAMLAALDPGDEVLVPEPMWVSYPEQARLCHAVPKAIPYPSTVSDFEKYLSSKTRMLVINNPNNPSGYVYSEKELRYLSDLAKSNDIYLLSDEAYSDFLIEDKFYSAGHFDQAKSNTIICNSISKNLGISGWRIGYAISNAAFVNQLLKVNQHVITCPATNLQHYLVKHFDDLLELTDPQIKAVVEKRSMVAAYLRSAGLEAVPGTAGFYLFVSIAPSRLNSQEFAMKLLEQDKICVVPGVGYGQSCDRHIRISVGSEPLEKIYRGIDCIKKLILESST